MSKSRVAIAIGAIAVVAAVAGTLLLEGSRKRSAADDRRAAAAAPAPEAPASSPARPDTPPEPLDSAARAPAAAGPASESVAVRGRVVLKGSGTPVRGATVAIRTGRLDVDHPETVAALGGWAEVERLFDAHQIGERLRALGGWKDAHATDSGEDGTFLVSVPADLPKFRFLVAADLAAYADRDAWFALGDPSVGDGVTLELVPGGRIEGTVAVRSGEPGAGAQTVVVSEASTRPEIAERNYADTLGRFVLRGVAEGKYRAAATLAGHGPAIRDGIEVRAGETTAVALTLGVESYVAGTVVDELGKGVAGAALQALRHAGRGADDPFGWLGYGATVSREDGSFRFGALLAGSHFVIAEKAGMLAPEPATVVVPEGSGIEGLRLVLQTGSSIAGRVVDSKGNPVPGASVGAAVDFVAAGANSRPRGGFSRAFARSSDDGSFRLVGVPEGPLVVTAEAEGRGKAEVRGVEAGREGIEIVLPGATGVAGVVLDAESGKPIPRFVVGGARVMTRGAGIAIGSEGVPERSFVSEDGSFECVDLQAGKYDLFVRADGFVREVFPGIAVKAGEVFGGLEVRLRQGATVRGTVLARDESSPVSGATVRVVDRSRRVSSPFLVPDSRDDPRTDPRGAFEIQGLDAEPVRLRVEHEAFAGSTSDPIELRSGETVEGIVIRLSRGGALDGYALPPDGPPYAGGKARATPLDDFEERWSQSWREGVAIDERGYFRIDRLPPGRYRVDASPAWTAASRGDPDARERQSLRAVALVEEGRTTRVEFETPVPAICTVRGRISRDGIGVEGAQVSIVPSRRSGDLEARGISGASWRGRSGEDGAYAIRRVPAGPAILRVQPSAWTGAASAPSATVQREIVVPDSAELVVDVSLSGGTVRGRVARASDGAPVAGCPVRIFPDASVRGPRDFGGGGFAYAGEDGSFRLNDVEPGAYFVRAGFVMPSGSPENLAGETRGPIEIADGGEAVVDFALTAGGTAVVTVLDPDGKPLAQTPIRVAPSGAPRDARRFVSGGLGLTDADGVARVSGLEPGTYHATADRTEFAAAESDDAEVARDRETPIRIQLRAGTRVRVRVVDPSGAPVGLLPLFTDARGRERFAIPPRRRESSDGEEWTGFVALLPGEYGVRIGGEGWKERSSTIRVGSDSPQDLILRLEPEETPR